MIDSFFDSNANEHMLSGCLSIIDQDQGRGAAPPLGAILFYRAIKEYAEKGARLLASQCLWHWLGPYSTAIQAALAKLGLTPSNIPRLIGLNYLRSGGVTREGGSVTIRPFKQKDTTINYGLAAVEAPPM